MKHLWKWVMVAGFILALFYLAGSNGERAAVTEESKVKKEESNINDFHIYLKIGETRIRLEIAETPEQQALGLSGRIKLDKDEGMLFVFETPGKYSFWMKDMNFPIDIIWLSEDGRIIDIKKDARPESYPNTFSPTEDAKNVLEVVSGFSDANHIKIGDKVEIFAF